MMILAAALPTACGWVDSTGVQGDGDDAAGLTNFTFEGSDVPLVSGASTAFLEEVPRIFTLDQTDQQLRNWQLELLSNEDGSVNRNVPGIGDPVEQCRGIDGFDAGRAGASLAEACTNAGQCGVLFEETDTDTGKGLRLRLPQLQQSVALSARLMASDSNDEPVERLQVICAISMNEAPLAVDDNYLARFDETRVVSADDPDNLLANDKDDDDKRNQGLVINSTPVQAPRLADEFRLGSDGSFFYRPADNLNFNGNGFIDDTFVYSVTDGVNEPVNATAVVRIVTGNRAPRLRGELQAFEIRVDDDVALGEPLFESFFDPDGDPLRFSVTLDSLPRSGNVSVTTGGILTGLPTGDDVGFYNVTLIISDGIDSISADFSLTIEAAEDENSAPIVADIGNRIVQNRFTYDVSGFFFDDDDDDDLTFTADGLPSGVSISDDGVISGRARNNNRGIYLVVVTASDGNGGTVSDAFRLVIT